MFIAMFFGAAEARDRPASSVDHTIRLASIAGGSALMHTGSPVTIEGPRRASSGRWVVPAGATLRVLTTGYSSTPDQTDASPFITASGTHVHDGTVATNFLPFGAKIRFPDYRSDQLFVVEDRHHPRLSDRVDIWFTSRAGALNFGKRTLRMEIVE